VKIAVALHRDSDAPARALVLPAIAGSAAFGAAIGSFVGGRQILYAAIKMPIFLFGTLAVCAALFAILTPRAIATAVRTIFTTTMVLGALAPPIFLAGVSLPKPAAYSHMVLILTAAVAIAGAWSVARLKAALPSTGLWLAWIAIYAFVGAQMGWLLKPWVGYTMVADRFIPLSQNLRGNFYEAAWGTLLNVVR